MAKRTKKRRAEPKFVPPTHNFLRDWFEAADKEKAAREKVFFPVDYDLLGVPIRMMRVADAIILIGIGSPFLCGGCVSVEDCAKFLWVLSPSFSYDPAERDAFLLRVGGLNFKQAKIDIEEYMDLVYMDAPAGEDSGGSLSFVASIVDLLASEYGWSEEAILSKELPRVFQYVNARNRRVTGKDFTPHRISQAAQARFMEELNKVPECHRERWRAHQWEEMQTK